MVNICVDYGHLALILTILVKTHEVNLSIFSIYLIDIKA